MATGSEPAYETPPQDPTKSTSPVITAAGSGTNQHTQPGVCPGV